MLVPLRKRAGANGGWDVVLTARATTMRAHAGEIALPGGKRDPDDDDDAGTAAREAREEIGMRTPRDATCVGRLPVILSRHGVSVRPVIGVVREGWAVREEEVSREEVAEVFTAPLEMFLSAEGHRYDDWAWPNAERAIRVHYFEYEGRQIWGLTATILIEGRATSVRQRARVRGGDGRWRHGVGRAMSRREGDHHKERAVMDFRL